MAKVRVARNKATFRSYGKMLFHIFWILERNGKQSWAPSSKIFHKCDWEMCIGIFEGKEIDCACAELLGFFKLGERLIAFSDACEATNRPVWH